MKLLLDRRHSTKRPLMNKAFNEDFVSIDIISVLDSNIIFTLKLLYCHSSVYEAHIVSFSEATVRGLAKWKL